MMISDLVFIWVGVLFIVVLFFCLSIVLSDSQEGVVALCCLVGNSSRTLIGLHELFLLLFLRLPRKGEFQGPQSANGTLTYILLDVESCAKNQKMWFSVIYCTTQEWVLVDSQYSLPQGFFILFFLRISRESESQGSVSHKLAILASKKP